VRFISPIDPDGGGTWLGVNEFGVTVGLLNFYSAEATYAPVSGARVSRGILVMSLLDSGSLEVVTERLERINRQQYMPFILFAIEDATKVAYWRWDGRELLRRTNPDIPLTTSGFQPEEVISFRRQLLNEALEEHGAVSRDALFAFHAHHDSESPTFSVSMEREEARTVSFTEIYVGAREISYGYTDGFPAHGTRFAPLTLARRDGANRRGGS
jgi:uncharacterized protein with NRDE domain